MIGQARPPTWGICKISKKCKREAGTPESDERASYGKFGNLVSFSWRGARDC